MVILAQQSRTHRCLIFSKTENLLSLKGDIIMGHWIVSVGGLYLWFLIEAILNFFN
jgi:hypothetical protein